MRNEDLMIYEFESENYQGKETKDCFVCIVMSDVNNNGRYFSKLLFPMEIKKEYKMKYIKDDIFHFIKVEKISVDTIKVRVIDERIRDDYNSEEYNVLYDEKRRYFPKDIKVGEYVKFDIDWTRTIKKLDIVSYPDQHEGIVSNLVVDSNEKKLISVSFDKKVKIWDVESGKCLKTLKGHKGIINVVGIVDNKIVSGSSDKTIRIWDMNTGSCLNILNGHQSTINSISSYNNKIISGSSDKTLKIWDIESGKCLDTFYGHTRRIISVIFDKDRKNIISSSMGGEIRIWDFDTGKCLNIIKDEERTIWSFKVQNNNLLGCSKKGFIKIWDLNNFKCSNCFATINENEEISHIEINGNEIIFLQKKREINFISIWNPVENTIADIYSNRCDIGSILVHDNKIYLAEDLIKVLNTEGKHLKTI